jgi:hypothetical protein
MLWLLHDSVTLRVDCASGKFTAIILAGMEGDAQGDSTQLSYRQVRKLSGGHMHAARLYAIRACLHRRNVSLEQPFVLYEKACRCFSASVQQAAGQTGAATALAC